MEPWKRVTAMVTVIVFSLQIRPMESFLTAYLTGPRANVTLDEVSDVLTPITIYMSVISSLITLLFSDYLRYKPVMIFCASMGILSYVCLIDSSTLFILKVYEVSYSFLKCTDPLYFGYLFAVIKDKKHYQIATGFAMSGIMSGMSVSGLLGQLVAYLNNDDYTSLIYYSLAGVTFATVLSVFLPSVEHEKKSHMIIDDDDAAKAKVFSKETIHDLEIPKYSSENDHPQHTESVPVVTNPFKRMYKDILQSYSDYRVLRWSLWDAMNMINVMQINLYVNILYSYIINVSGDKIMLLNGLVNFLATISGAICAYKIGKINVNWTRHGDAFMAFSALILGLTMYLCYYSTNTVVVYVTYIFYSTVAEAAYVVAISQIGKQLQNKSYGLVLGFNVFIGIVFATFLSAIMTHFGTSIPGHFLVYSCTYTALGIMYGCLACFKMYMKTNNFERLL